MSARHVIKSLFLPELKFIKQIPSPNKQYKTYLLEKEKTREYCPKCATQATTVYDHVIVSARDVPIQNRNIMIKIKKRRYRCSKCKSVFREPINGIRKGFRTTQRFRHHLMKQATDFTNLDRVVYKNHVSDSLLYRTYFEQVELEMRKHQSPWPKTLGIDEHGFRHNEFGRKEFVTVFVDINNKKVREVSQGRYQADILTSEHILKVPGRDRVKNVIIDLSPGFKSFAEDFFPNATITADKFHVLKLLTNSIMKYKKEVIGKLQNKPFKTILLKKGKNLKPAELNVLRSILHFYPNLKDVYTAKEALFSLYEIKGYKRASKALTRFTNWLAYSKIPELQTLRNTLMKWREEILNYFKTNLTNAMTEGYNRKAKLIQRNAYGFRNFKNYRLKLLYHCR